MNLDHQVSNSVKPNAKAAKVTVNPKHLKKDGSLVDSEVCTRFFALFGLRHTAQPVNACDLMLLLHRLCVYAKPADLQRDDDDREWLMHSHSHLKKLSRLSRGQLERGLSDLTGHGIIATDRRKYGKAKERRTGIRFTLLGQALFDPQGTLGVIDSTAKPMVKHQKSDAALLAAQASFSTAQETSVVTPGGLKNGAHHDLKTGVQADHGGTELEVTPDLEIGVTKRILNTELASLLPSEEVHLNSASSQAGAAPPGSCASGWPSTSGSADPGEIPLNLISADQVEPLSSENSTLKFCITGKPLAQVKLELMADSKIKDDTTTVDLERMWRRVIADIHGHKPPAFKPKQRGQLGHLVKALAPLYQEAGQHLVKPSSPKPLAASELSIDVPELAIVSYVIERVLRRWDQFTTLVRNRWFVECGIRRKADSEFEASRTVVR